MIIGVCSLVASVAAAADLSAVERRNAVLRTAETKPPNGVELLTKALNDGNMLVRRAGARSLTAFGKSAEKGLLEGVHNSDAVVRMICLTGLKELGLITGGSLAVGIKDRDGKVRGRAMDIIATMKPYPKEIAVLLEKGGGRETTSKDQWPFYRDAPLLCDRVDNIVRTIHTIPLPRSGWRLKEDPMRSGVKEGWFDPAFNDDKWPAADIAKHWGQFGKNHTGIAWYRVAFTLPVKPREMEAAEIAFGAVDESAWVWMNGKYVGEHDVGPAGWKEPFQFDVTQIVKWGQENQLTVRVLNIAAAGGIWKPVKILIQQALR